MNLRSMFSFQGRVRRLHWWVGSFVTTGVLLAFAIIGVTLMTAVYGHPANIPGIMNLIMGWVFLAAYAGAIWVHLALGVKRLHDRNSSGWLLVLLIVPFVNLGLIVMMAFFDGTQGPNQYGPSPKGIGGASDRELGSVFS